MKVRFDGTKQTDPTVQDGFHVEYASAKRAGFRWRWRFMLLLVASPVLVWLWLLAQDQVLVRADGILTTEPIQMRASKSGFVTSVKVNPGAKVEVGQQIFDLSSPEIDRKIVHWQTNLEELIAYRDKMIAELRQTLQTYQVNLEDSRKRQDAIAENYRQLAEKGLFKLADEMQLNELRRALSRDERQQMVDLERLESLRFTHDLADEIRDLEMSTLSAAVLVGPQSTTFPAGHI